MLLSPFVWFWLCYLSLGTFILMEAIVVAWDSLDYHIGVKIIGSIIAIAAWPMMFIVR